VRARQRERERGEEQAVDDLLEPLPLVQHTRSAPQAEDDAPTLTLERPHVLRTVLLARSLVGLGCVGREVEVAHTDTVPPMRVRDRAPASRVRPTPRGAGHGTQRGRSRLRGRTWRRARPTARRARTTSGTPIGRPRCRRRGTGVPGPTGTNVAAAPSGSVRTTPEARTNGVPRHTVSGPATFCPMMRCVSVGEACRNAKLEGSATCSVSPERAGLG
jgi:hypothetical protein